MFVCTCVCSVCVCAYMCVYVFRMAKRSWFGGLMGMEQEHHFVMVRDKTFSQVKADLVHAFLSVSIAFHFFPRTLSLFP